MLVGQNTQDLALAFEVLCNTTLDLDTLHLKVRPKNKIMWPTRAQQISVFNTECLSFVFQILQLFCVV
jgi:hypothetical protein